MSPLLEGYLEGQHQTSDPDVWGGMFDAGTTRRQEPCNTTLLPTN
jgi:hypothetical protein